MEDTSLANWLENTSKETKASSEPELNEILNMVGTFEKPEVDAEALFDKVQSKITENTAVKSDSKIRWFRVASVAAAAAAFLFVFNFLTPAQTTIDTFNGEVFSHNLPDDSSVKLNDNSSIKYKENFNKKRKLFLDGEAFFEVEKGSQFLVVTDNGLVEVLGTSFNVFSREDHFVVSCKTGKVEVSANGNSAILLPGQMVRLRSKKFELNDTQISAIGAWDLEETHFDNAPLNEVLSSLAAKYNLSLTAFPSEASQMNYTGNYVHNDLDKALKMICLPMGVKYHISEDQFLTISL